MFASTFLHSVYLKGQLLLTALPQYFYLQCFPNDISMCRPHFAFMLLSGCIMLWCFLCLGRLSLVPRGVVFLGNTGLFHHCAWILKRWCAFDVPLLFPAVDPFAVSSWPVGLISITFHPLPWKLSWLVLYLKFKIHLVHLSCLSTSVAAPAVTWLPVCLCMHVWCHMTQETGNLFKKNIFIFASLTARVDLRCIPSCPFD